MADALSDRAWADICEAAKLIPDADARAEIETVLFVEYPAFNYNAEAVAAAHRRGLSMLRHCAALAALHGQAPHFAAIKQERNTYYIERLRRSALALVIASGAIRRASRGHRDTQREWLVSRLCGIWLDHFHAEAHRAVLRQS